MRISRRDLIGAAGTFSAGVLLGIPGLSLAEQARLHGVRLGATDWNLGNTAKPEALALGKRIGFEGVEVSLGMGPVGADKLPLADPEVQARYLEDARKHRISIGGTCLNILHRNYLKNDKLGQKWVADSIPITKALKARVILLPFFGPGALRTRAEMDYVADFLREIGPEAHKTGVILGLENTISAEDNARILDRASSAAVKVYYDVGNSTYNGFDILKEIRWLGRERICQFHIKDNPHYLGEGKIDVPAVIDAIAQIRFQGWAFLETDSPSRNIEADMGRNLRYVRELMNRRAREGEDPR
jgi:L-ribulose-5-phosphate 3-epimerase